MQTLPERNKFRINSARECFQSYLNKISLHKINFLPTWVRGLGNSDCQRPRKKFQAGCRTNTRWNTTSSKFSIKICTSWFNLSYLGKFYVNQSFNRTLVKTFLFDSDVFLILIGLMGHGGDALKNCFQSCRHGRRRRVTTNQIVDQRKLLKDSFQSLDHHHCLVMRIFPSALVKTFSFKGNLPQVTIKVKLPGKSSGFNSVWRAFNLDDLPPALSAFPGAFIIKSFPVRLCSYCGWNINPAFA